MVSFVIYLLPNARVTVGGYQLPSHNKSSVPRSTYWLKAVANARTIVGRLLSVSQSVRLERDRNHKMKFFAWF